MMVVALAAATGACRSTNPYSHAAALADDGNCEQSLSAFRQGGRGASYALTASGRQSDVLIAITSGIAVGVQSPRAGHLASTENDTSRDDPDFSGLSRAMRDLASCYESRGDRASLVTSFAQLQQIVESPVYAGASSGEQQRVDSQLDLVETRLKAVDPGYLRFVEAKARELGRAKARLAAQGQ